MRLAILLIGNTSTPTGCGPCQLSNPVYGSLVRVPSNGSFSTTYPLPCSPLALGLPIVWQAAVLPVASGPCPSFPVFAASNRLVTVLDW